MKIHASSLDSSSEAEVVRPGLRSEPNDKDLAGERKREQMLKLVAKGFYNELINYGVREGEILRVASHLLDNLMSQERKPGSGVEYYNRLFNIASVRDEWRDHRQLSVQHVVLRPLQLPVVGKVVAWLRVPAVRDSFVPAFPETESELQRHFTHPTREYFGVYYNDQPSSE